ncbi:MAG: FAD-binding oxidoreductase, partial [Alphaproteobacteria bacterium]|nr:FAD-binding oxidoreductase [Alphaproteobacteria bacterium]
PVGTSQLAPLLRPGCVAAAAYEAGVMDIDVAALHQGYLRGIKRRGGVVICGVRAERLDHSGAYWQAVARDTVVSGRILVNAAGAWAGLVGEMAGAASIGLVPKRRTAIVVDAPPATEIGAMPAVDFASGAAYLKPDGHRIMASPGDQTPIEPQDVRPDEMEAAELVDWLERETFITVNRVPHSWAGLRSFVADETPVVGFDATAPDFFWLAGQGGYGIMMSPALGRAAAALIVSGDLPADLREGGIKESDLSPARFA